MMKNTHDIVISGKYVNMREAEISDSEFILSLRTDPKKSRYIHSTSSDLKKQEEYMLRYKTLENEWYFIIENKKGEPIGTNSVYPYPRITKCWYDEKNDKLGILGPGRWLLKDGLIPFESIESDLLIKKFCFDFLKLSFLPMMIHEDNKTVLDFHKKWGAKIFDYDEELKHYLLNLEKSDYDKNLVYFNRFLYRNIKGEKYE